MIFFCRTLQKSEHHFNSPVLFQAGKREGQEDLMRDVLRGLLRTQYSYEELTDENLPEGVDPRKIEAYLSDEEFEV